jgi:hypothetical protein
MTEAQVRRVLSDLHRMTSGSSFASASVRDFLAQWVNAKTGTVSAATNERAVLEQQPHLRRPVLFLPVTQ